MRRTALGAALVVFALGALFVVRPFMAAQRDFAAEVPAPASLYQTDTVPLAHGAPVCFDKTVIEQHSEQVRFKVYSPKGPAPAMRVRLQGDGYAYTGDVPAGTLDTAVVSMPVPAAPKDIPLRVCISNLGKQEIGLFASNDRTRARSTAIIRGQDTLRSVWFGFYEIQPKAITERLPTTLARMTIFRPGYVGRGLLWVLLVLFAVGVPAAVVWAYLRALREDEVAAPEPVDVNARRSLWRRVIGDR